MAFRSNKPFWQTTHTLFGLSILGLRGLSKRFLFVKAYYILILKHNIELSYYNTMAHRKLFLFSALT